jgi:acyl carrier protein
VALRSIADCDAFLATHSGSAQPRQGYIKLTEKMDLLQELRCYIVADIFHGKPPSDFGDDYDLIESGAMDSMNMMNLITWISKQFSIEFRPNDLVPRNFKSVQALSRFLETKISYGQADQDKIGQ